MDKNKLIAIMAKKGMTQADLADKAHLSRTAVYRMLQGSTPRIPTLGKVARALDVEPSELLDATK